MSVYQIENKTEHEPVVQIIIVNTMKYVAIAGHVSLSRFAMRNTGCL